MIHFQSFANRSTIPHSLEHFYSPDIQEFESIHDQSRSLADRTVGPLSSPVVAETELTEVESVFARILPYTQREKIVTTTAPDGTIVHQYESVREFFDGLHEPEEVLGQRPSSSFELVLQQASNVELDRSKVPHSNLIETLHISPFSPSQPLDGLPHFSNSSPSASSDLTQGERGAFVEMNSTKSTPSVMELDLISPLDNIVVKLYEKCIFKINLFTKNRMQSDYTIEPHGYKEPRRNVLLGKCAVVRELHQQMEQFDLRECSFYLEMSRKLLKLGEGINEVVDWLDKTHQEVKSYRKINKFADDFPVLVAKIQEVLPADEFKRSTICHHAERFNQRKVAKRRVQESIDDPQPKRAKKGAKDNSETPSS